MKFYYIQDTMFQKDPIYDEIRNRLIKQLQRNKVKMIIVEEQHDCTDEYVSFLETYRTIPVIRCKQEEMEAEVDQTKLTYKEHTLHVDGYPSFVVGDDFCVEYDDQTKTARHIYLQVFVNHQETSHFDFLLDELEDMIEDRVLDFIKKQK